jgi:hypothetical protein
MAYGILPTSFRDAPLCAGPESMLPVVVMDSGLARKERAPRNDELLVMWSGRRRSSPSPLWGGWPAAGRSGGGRHRLGARVTPTPASARNRRCAPAACSADPPHKGEGIYVRIDQIAQPNFA